MSSGALSRKKVGIIGAGPIGLYAALRLVEDGYAVTIWEKGAVGSNVQKWGFVELFSCIALNVPPLMRKVLEGAEHAMPDDADYLSGTQFRDRVLAPLARWLASRSLCTIKEHTMVVSLGRGRLLKGEGIGALGDESRRTKKFRVVVREQDGAEFVEKCDILVDASGTYAQSSALRSGEGGILAPGESAAEERGLIIRVLPDPEAMELRDKVVAVLGSGYSAITTVKNLYSLPAPRKPRQILWLVRRRGIPPYTRVENDPLPQRDDLAKFGNALAEGSEDVTFVDGVAIQAFELLESSLRLHVDRVVVEERTTEALTYDVDVLFSLTGYRPDPNVHSELQVHTCYASDGPMALAATLLAAKGGSGDCLSQAAPGPATLQNPEPGFFIVGMKSYGRNASFLMRVGYEQVDLLVDALRDL